MKVAHLSTSDSGGAGIAAKSLHLGLLEKGIDSTFISKWQLGERIRSQVLLEEAHHESFLNRLLNRIKSGLGINQKELEAFYLEHQIAGFEHFSFPWSDIEPYSLVEIQNADILHLNWISDRFIDYKKIHSPGKKIVWTLHDMNPFTGGCHHSDGCLKFESNCNFCFQLKGTVDEYLSSKILAYKMDAFKHLGNDDMIIVTPSEWLSKLSSRSRLFGRFEHRLIRNVIDFPQESINREMARHRLGLKANEVAFLFVAHHFDNPRKGISILLAALKNLTETHFKVFVIGERLTSSDNFQFIQLGYVKDRYKMKELYTMADAFILPSIAENFPNTIAEALLCGTPVIASRVGGITEQVNSQNGLLVAPSDLKAWSEALSAFIRSVRQFDRKEIKESANRIYNNEDSVNAYIDVYKQLSDK